jgi:hypothetical protein
MTAVADKTQFTEFVQAEIDSRWGGSDDLGQTFLARLGYDSQGLAFLAEVGQP